jgi:hypothetical protein
LSGTVASLPGLWPHGDVSFCPQSAADIGQIQELQLQLEEMKKEKQKVQEQVCAAMPGGRREALLRPCPPSWTLSSTPPECTEDLRQSQ